MLKSPNIFKRDGFFPSRIFYFLKVVVHTNALCSPTFRNKGQYVPFTSIDCLPDLVAILKMSEELAFMYLRIIRFTQKRNV